MTKPLIPKAARLLLVDDDITFCSVLKRALLRHGFSVAIAHATEQALEVAEHFQPTHAVVDLKLGDASGLHLIKPLLSFNNGMRIIVLTGYGSIPTAVKAITEGAGNYLAKPVSVDTILSAFESSGKEPAEDPAPAVMSLRRLEWEYIQRVLAEHDGNISATARGLGMHRRTLQRKLQKRPGNS